MTEFHPMQTSEYDKLQRGRGGAKLPTEVTLRAYEVYCALYGEQPAMITDGCRGGFGASEIIAFLYARSFPRNEWRARVDEAFKRPAT